MIIISRSPRPRQVDADTGLAPGVSDTRAQSDDYLLSARVSRAEFSAELGARANNSNNRWLLSG